VLYAAGASHVRDFTPDRLPAICGHPPPPPAPKHALPHLATLRSLLCCAVLCYMLQARHMCEIQRLMGCLLFVDRAPEDTPYADLLSPTRWEEVAHEFARQACSLMGQVGWGGGFGGGGGD
jgi:hypothetical protein